MGPSPPTPPRVLGRYALYDKIASGGMATVHLGRLLGPVGFARTVAIKRLHPQFAGDPEFVSMFLDEARLVARISHPNVVPTLDVVALDGELFLVMEYVRGESLLRLIQASLAKGAPIPPPIAATLLVGVLHGLHAAHEAKNEMGQPLGIVHRDVSPQNILVGVDGVARVLDFGVAKARGRLQTTREGQLKGKLAYMAPEQIGGQVTRATDVYAASVVLWETLSGRRLFTGDNEAHLLGQVLAGCRVPPSAHAPAVSRALDAVTLRGLAVAPGDRYESAREMALALEDAVPLVSPSKVGEWVEAAARDTLDRRSARISAIESDSALQAPAALTERTLVDGPSRASVAAGARVAVTGRRLGWGAVAVVALLCLALALRSRGDRSSRSPPASADASAGPAPTTLADLPSPATHIPEAAAEYSAGMQALHDNSWSLAEKHFERAVALDPTLALAHLRVAMTTLLVSPASPRKREEFAKAAALRAQLAPRDQTLLEALEPILQRAREDRAETRARLVAASQAYPLDVELLDWLGLLQEGAPERALEPAERAIRLDPKDGQALQTKGHSLALLGRNAEARASLVACADLAVDSSDCLLALTRLDAIEGKCDAFEADARRMLDRDAAGGLLVATTMLATGQVAAASEVLDQAAESEADPALRAIQRIHGRATVAEYVGDFARAEKLARAESAAVSGAPSTRSDRGLRIRVATTLIDVLEETGKEDDARRVAEEFRARSESFTSSSAAKGLDLSLRILRKTVGKGGLGPEEFEQRRAAWVEQRLSTSGAFPGLVWTLAYASTAFTPDDARAALAARPRFAPLTSFWFGSPSPDAYAGEVNRLAGAGDEAVAYLRRAAANCNGPLEPVVATRASLGLGQALEPKDGPAACAAYAVVLERWGRARPRSVTAERARDRARALGCGR